MYAVPVGDVDPDYPGQGTPVVGIPPCDQTKCYCGYVHDTYPGCDKVNFHYLYRCMPNSSVVLITYTMGMVEVGTRAPGDEEMTWEPLEPGATLPASSYIKASGPGSSVGWKRAEGYPSGGELPPGEQGGARKIHIGSYVDTVATRREPPGQRASLTFQAIDLFLEEGVVDVSEATIIEEPGCTGFGHSGLTSPLAIAAPIAETPPGQVTTFSGRLIEGAGGMEVTFRVDSSSPIPIGSTALFGPNQGNLILVPPGGCVTYFDDGTFDTSSCADQAVPTVSEWGLVVLTLVLLVGGKVYFGHRRKARLRLGKA
jgi:hypothetical protein